MALTPSPIAHTAGASQILINGEPICRDSIDSIRSERDILPDGMDVSEALMQCEDPTLGWSLQFWITIADPVVSVLAPSLSRDLGQELIR